MTLQAFLGHDLRPRADNKACDEAMAIHKIRARPDFGGYLYRQQVALLGLDKRLHGTALSLAILGRIAALLTFKISQQLRKMLRVAGMLFRQQVGDILQTLHELLKAGCAFAGITQAGAGNGFKQSSGRMTFVAEKSRVGHCQAQKGRFSVGNDLPDRQQQPFILGHLLNHHADHFNGQ